jgi:GMP synthase (glutamine-hydrolysing)
MRIHYLQHVPFEDAGFIAHWAAEGGHRLSRTAIFDGDPFPDMDAFDLLAVMGGPMGVHDDREHEWLTPEKKFIETALGRNTPVVGICLGAQLMADVLGARVYRNDHREIGWHPVARSAPAGDTAFKEIIPERFDAFHWHGDTFDLPAGAVHLAENEACRHQAFFYPPFAVGLQFHLESTRESIEAIMHHCADELIDAPYVQNENRIRNQADSIARSNGLMGAILRHLTTESQASGEAHSNPR